MSFALLVRLTASPSSPTTAVLSSDFWRDTVIVFTQHLHLQLTDQHYIGMQKNKINKQ